MKIAIIEHLNIKNQEKKMRKLSYAIVLFLIILSFPLYAEILPKSFSITPFVGKYYFDSSQHIESNGTAGLGLAYHLSKNWAAELSYLYGEFNSRFYDALYDDCCCCGIDSHFIHLDALYHFQPDKKLVPYFAAGPGYINLKYGCGKKINEALFNYGGGIKYFISKRLSLRGDVRHIYTFDQSNNNLSITVGLTYHFGGKIQKAAEPEPLYLPPKYITETVSIDLKIQFDFDKAEIKPEYHNNIEKVAEFLKQYPDTKAVIEGHTCAIGTDEYNLDLSQRRALNVCQYLINIFGINPLRLQSVGFGKAKPVADNFTEMGREKNRRVIAVISTTITKLKE